MFDPDKVERFYNVEFDGVPQGDMVLAFDFDNLLELYKEIKGKYNRLRGVE